MIYLLDHTKEWESLTPNQRRGYEHRKSQDLLCYVISKELGENYHESMVEMNSYGKPSIRNHIPVEYNYSHCKGLIACVLASKEIGIDVEKIRSFDRKTMEKVCSEKEVEDIMQNEYPDRRFFEYWTLKESYAKAIGTSIYQEGSMINFTIVNSQKIVSNHLGFYFRLYYFKKQYVVAVCNRE